MNALLLTLLPALLLAVPATDAEATTVTESTPSLFDFAAGATPWPSIDDVVMGGVSASEMVVENGVAVFRGEVSLENNGGFASVRSAPRTFDLAPFAGIQVRVRGDGKRYKLRLRTTTGFDGPSYEVALTPPAGAWTTLRFPFADFEPVFRGRRVGDAPPLAPERIRTVGLLISDGQEGPFRLEIDRISAWR